VASSTGDPVKETDEVSHSKIKLETKLDPEILEYVADMTVPFADALKPNRLEISHTKDDSRSESQFAPRDKGDFAYKPPAKDSRNDPFFAETHATPMGPLYKGLPIKVYISLSSHASEACSMSVKGTAHEESGYCTLPGNIPHGSTYETLLRLKLGKPCVKFAHLAMFKCS